MHVDPIWCISTVTQFANGATLCLGGNIRRVWAGSRSPNRRGIRVVIMRAMLFLFLAVAAIVSIMLIYIMLVAIIMSVLLDDP